MYFIKSIGPYRGNPTSRPFSGSVALPDELLSAYLATKGFCTIVVEDGIVTGLTVDQEALDAYEAEHPDVPEPDPPPTVEDLQQENKLLRAQLQAQTERSDFIEDVIAEMAGVVYSGGEEG